METEITRGIAVLNAGKAFVEQILTTEGRKK